MNPDLWIAFYANQIGGLAPWIEKTVVFFAEYFPYVVAVLFVVWAYGWGRHPLSFSPSKEVERLKLVAEGVGAGLIARGFVEIIRFFVHRPRPFVADPTITALISETSYSFPSGHATFFFALSTVVYMYNKRLGVWFFIASSVIGLTRIMAGVHYLSDIAGGALLGSAVGWCVHRFFARKSSVQL